MVNVKCPFHNGELTESKRTAFVEVGEYDGDSYEEEGDVKEYYCAAGNHNIYVEPYPENPIP